MTSAPFFIVTTEWKRVRRALLSDWGDPPARAKRGAKGAASSFAPPLMSQSELL